MYNFRWGARQSDGLGQQALGLGRSLAAGRGGSGGRLPRGLEPALQRPGRVPEHAAVQNENCTGLAQIARLGPTL